MVAVVVYFVGFRGKDDKPSTAKPTAQPTAQTLHVPGVPFTFEYPTNFATAPLPPGVLWLAGVSPSDLIDVRRVAGQAYGPEALSKSMRRALEKQKTLTIQAQEAGKVAGKDMVKFTVVSGSGATELQSQLIFFSTPGATWQLECQSQPSGRDYINNACARALQTLKFS